MTSRKRFTSLLVLMLAFAAIFAASAQAADTPAPSKSGCEVCRDSKDCSKAYRGSPGQYCGAWLSTASQRMACCCASGDVCDLGNYSCNCKPGKSSAKSTPAPKKNSKKWIIIAVVVVVVLLLIGVGVYFYMKSRDSIEEPVSIENGYVPPPPQQQVVYTQPAYTEPAPVYKPAPQPVYATAAPVHTEVHHHHGNQNGGGMSTGAGVAVGAAAGLVGGALIGHAMADRGHDSPKHHHHHQHHTEIYASRDNDSSYAGDF